MGTDRSMPAVSGKLPRLAGIATASGAFSGLFGVGGGIVIVPLLILWLEYEEHEATGTSLAAIVVISALGAAAQFAFGAVDVPKGLMVGVPAVAGVLAGTALQQRLSGRAVSGLFAGVLVVAAILLVV
jgi:uncharacterized membrane protein YfcA